ncbi:SDR family oxidoreductase [Nocardia beijingensis]|uniref:NAD-dependent epimerase/dehydratase family protein n=1 Tax=Nocardia beijingensis TaxID=95162 RepID=UPI003450844A
MTVTLVTGGAGYIGGVLVPALCDSGRHVRVVDPQWFGLPSWQASENLHILNRDSRDLTAADLSDVDEIIDLAAVSSEHTATRLPSLAWAVNSAARCRLATLAREAGVRRYVLPSSSNLYGAGDEPFTEEVAVSPESVYAAANRSAETHVLGLADRRFCPVVLRQATVYGWSPHLRYDLVVNAMTADILHTGRCRVLGSGSQRRPLIWIKDLVHIHLRLLMADAEKVCGRVFNAGARDEQFLIRELPSHIGEQLGIEPEIRHYGEDDPMSHVLSYQRLHDGIGVEVGPSLGIGVAELASALRTYPECAAEWRVRRSDWFDRQVASCG